MDKPIPMRCGFVEKNGSNTSLSLSRPMPGPASDTETSAKFVTFEIVTVRSMRGTSSIAHDCGEVPAKRSDGAVCMARRIAGAGPSPDLSHCKCVAASGMVWSFGISFPAPLLMPRQRRIFSSTFCRSESMRTDPSSTKGVLACCPTCSCLSDVYAGARVRHRSVAQLPSIKTGLARHL